ncbi:MAG: hypothetical protein MUC49_03585 [Raineya sp.]|jgi:hypothetical protein|nr:hypothetical protein [Raineya sp.]
MTAIAIFGICLLITVILIVTFLIISGTGAMMLIVIFPAIVAETITGERGFFSPNGSGSKSILFNAIIWIVVLLEVVLVASIFFGIYCLFFGFPHTETSSKIVNTLSIATQIDHLLIINKILLALNAYFVIMYIYYTYKFRDTFKEMRGLTLFSNRIMPMISFLWAIIYLIGCLNYLQSYSETSSLSLAFKLIGATYILYILYSMGKTIYVLLFTLRLHLSELKFGYWLGLTQSIVYNVLFFYFFFQL